MPSVSDTVAEAEPAQKAFSATGIFQNIRGSLGLAWRHVNGEVVRKRATDKVVKALTTRDEAGIYTALPKRVVDEIAQNLVGTFDAEVRRVVTWQATATSVPMAVRFGWRSDENVIEELKARSVSYMEGLARNYEGERYRARRAAEAPTKG